MIKAWPNEQLSAFGAKLEDYHRVFGVFWTMASISFTDDVVYCPTAMVFLKGKPRIIINEAWWNTLTPKDQVFVIVHECLHVMLEHGIRNGKLQVPNATPIQVNMAQDITINELAEQLFGIPRTALTDWEKYCWISTCFPSDGTVLPNETYVYYLEKLATDNKDLQVKLIDGHAEENDDDDNEDISDSVVDLFNELTDEEAEAISRAIGHEKGNRSLGGTINKQPPTHKLSIKKLIKGMRHAKSKNLSQIDTFVTRARRFSSLADNLYLPNAHDSKTTYDRFNIALCLDVSGSVVHLRSLFYELRELFLKEKDLLEVKSYVFADEIQEITQLNQTYEVGGGNAPFQLIEAKLLDKLAGKKPDKYPDCVIVITDGHAGGVRPKHPGRWLWLLTENHTTASIPKESRHYLIDDVVF